MTNSRLKEQLEKVVCGCKWYDIDQNVHTSPPQKSARKVSGRDGLIASKDEWKMRWLAEWRPSCAPTALSGGARR